MGLAVAEGVAVAEGRAQQVLVSWDLHLGAHGEVQPRAVLHSQKLLRGWSSGRTLILPCGRVEIGVFIQIPLRSCPDPDRNQLQGRGPRDSVGGRDQP